MEFDGFETFNADATDETKIFMISREKHEKLILGNLTSSL